MDKYYKISTLAVILIYLLLGCKNVKNEDPFIKFRDEIASVESKPAKVSDVAIYLEKSEAEYLPKITLNTSIIDKYMSGDSLAFLNNKNLSAGLMGMYTADFAYHLVFNQRDSAFESYSAAQLIANELGFGDVYVKNLISRHESDTFNVETMLGELDQTLALTNENLESSERIQLFLAFLSANFIQKQYQINSTIQAYKSKDISDDNKLLLAKELVVTALGQQKTLEVLIDQIENNPLGNSGYYLDQLKALHSILLKLTPLNDNIDELQPEDVFQNNDFDAMYEQLKSIQEFILGQSNL